MRHTVGSVGFIAAVAAASLTPASWSVPISGTAEGTAPPPSVASPSTVAPAQIADEFPPAADTSRIIPVSGDLAEVVYELGFGDSVVATDISATYPEEAANSEKIGYQRTLNAETILAFEPTLVIADDRAGPPEVFELIRDAGVEVVIIPYHADIQAPAYKVRAVASTLGLPDDGEALVAEFEDDLAAAAEVAATHDSGDPPVVMALYLRGSGVQLIFGEGSGIDAVIEAAGGVDAGSLLGVNGNGELATEAIVGVAPDFYLVTGSGLDSVGGIDGLPEIPGLAETPAGRNRAVLSFEDQYLYGLGPRTGQLVSELSIAFSGDPAADSSPSTPPTTEG